MGFLFYSIEDFDVIILLYDVLIYWVCISLLWFVMCNVGDLVFFFICVLVFC